jgi:glycosyltransferase involved in cell wall biosynthesis
MNATPLVSIIIPTRDSAKTVGICLWSINKQTYPKIEKIVVDQQSTDDTKDIAENHGAEVLLVHPSRFYTPPSISRNIGANLASGKYIFHIDSDMEIPSTVVEECVVECEIGGAGAVVIPEIDVGEGFWSKCKALERSMYKGDQLIQAARFFNKAYFDRIGGYDPDVSSGEDWDIHQRIKRIAEISSIKTAIIHHQGKTVLMKQLRKKYHYGKTIEEYFAKHPKQALKQFNPMRVYLKNPKILANNLNCAFGLVVLRTLEIIAACVGLLESKAHALTESPRTDSSRIN